MIVDTPLKELEVEIKKNQESKEIRTKNLLAVLIVENDNENLQERRKLRKIHMTEGNFEFFGKKYEVYIRAD